MCSSPAVAGQLRAFCVLRSIDGKIDDQRADRRQLGQRRDQAARAVH